MAGIVSYGGYVPRYRLSRKVIAEAMGWFNPANLAYARGEKAVANYDEDSLTMASAAALDALKGLEASTVDALYFASTTMPFKERKNAGIISMVLGMREDIATADFASSLTSGTSALLSALDAVVAKRAGTALVCAADCRLGRAGSMQEMVFGDGGAAFLVGDGDGGAEFKGSYSLTCDYVDHFRGSGDYDRGGEDRWIRDEGFGRLIGAAIKGFTDRYGVGLSEFTKVIYPCHYEAEHRKIAKSLGLEPERVQSPMTDAIGDTGTAQSLIMMVRALEEAKRGDRILLVSYGNGCDVLWFDVTGTMMGRRGIQGHLSKREELSKYERYLVFRGLIPVERGGRGEEEKVTLLSYLWRHRRTVFGLYGTRCRRCGTPQFPPQKVCVNPACNAIGDMEDYRFADRRGFVFNFTGDMLAFSYDPPQIYGTVEFEGGGRFIFDFADCRLDQVKVGMPVEMSFRRKYYDARLGIEGYFWKAVPLDAADPR